jgi:hypothetical protein
MRKRIYEDRILGDKKACARLNGTRCKAIYVSNGSGDDSMKMILEECKNNVGFSITTLPLIFRHQAGLAGGLGHARK